MKQENVFEQLGEILNPIQGPFKTMEEMYDSKLFKKEAMRNTIINNLKALTPGKSRFADLFRTMVDRNFENVVRLILEEYTSNPSGMGYCIGEDNINLILKYSEL